MPRLARISLRDKLPAALLIAALGGCSGGTRSGSTPPTTPAALSLQAQAGEALFCDVTLSASGRQACSTCHVRERAFTADPAADQGLPVPLGGRNMDLPGFRNAPSLAYASFTPGFSIDSDHTASGGFFRDGRASSLAEQAQAPFIAVFEMANQDAAEVVQRLRQSPATLQKFIAAFGSTALDHADEALADIGAAIAAYETEDADFHAFSSKFDAWQTGTAQLTAQELQGLALFNNPGKGNCAACHPSQRQEFSDHALFTDFTYDNIGIPRNWKIPFNLPNPVSPVSGVALNYLPAPMSLPVAAEYGFYDLGLCGPFQPAATDPAPRVVFQATTTLCGLFKVPTLRNAALTAPYFHNGVFATLREAIEWYVTRDLNNNTANNPTPLPAGADGNPYAAVGSFYIAADGTPDAYEYNDLPAQYDANVNAGETPYTPPVQFGGQSPTLSSAEIDAVVAFLCTLTDGYDPAHPQSYNLPAQCLAAAAAADSVKESSP
ncbi:MAG TPA: cytochrome c peroxidase [Steroidobacteraceae bacterium]|nr:cytochrome c peroxidase [Steroidobacteraceae bacterium]